MGNIFDHINIRLTLLLIAIGSFGLGVILTIDRTLFLQQLAFLAVGTLIMAMLSRIDGDILFVCSPIFYVIGILFLSLSYLGPVIRGATRWIMVFGIQLQPSELVKPLLLLGLAFTIAKYPPNSLKHIALHTVLFSIPFFLILKQPDLGTSLVYASMWTAMMIAGGLPLWVVGLCVAGLVMFAPVGWHGLANYQQKRILTFLDPSTDPGGSGYNALQSVIAVGSGQIFGKGLGMGTQSHLRFLPEYHTDFIFASLVEELGFVGGCALLLLYALLLWQISRPFFRQEIRSPFVFIYGIGLLFMILSQIGINTGMNMGLLPITGITLPLVSYGGSSLLSVMASFGIFIALQKKSPWDEPSHSIFRS